MNEALYHAGAGGKVLATFANGCGAISYSPSANLYWGGNGASRGDAEAAALGNNYADAYIDYWVCTSGHL